MLSFANIVTGSELKDEEELSEIREDVKEECEKYGPVLELHICKTGPRIGQIVVKFQDVNGANGARAALHNRYFNNNRVEVTYIDPALFDSIKQE